MKVINMPQGDLLKPNVHGQLGRLKSKIRNRLAGEGLAWIVLSIVAAIFVTLALDYMLHLEPALRGLLMLAAIAGLGYVTWRQVLLPLKVAMSDEDLALLVEKRYNKLGDRLISALQFGKASVPPGTSPAMIQRVAIEANAIAEQVEFEQVVEQQNLRRMSLMAACALVLLAGFSVWQTNTMGLWFQRNILFQNTPWPQSTYLTVQNANNQHDFTVLRGDDLTVRVTVDENSREIPPNIVLHADYSSVGPTEERLDLMPDGHSYEKTFQAVSEPFSFYVVGNDDKRDKAKPHNVTLIDPPALASVTYSIAYPQYMHRPDSEYESVKGVITAPLGSTLTFSADSTKDLSAARMLLDGQEIGTVRLGGSNNDKRKLIGQLSILGANKLSQKMLRFSLTDSDGYSNRQGQQFMVQVQPDLAPTVEIKTSGVGTSVTPFALIPVGVQVHDDIGVATVNVGMTQVRKATTQLSTQPTSLPVSLASTQGSQTREWGQMTAVQPAPDGRKDFSGTDSLDLSTLKTRPNIGDVVAVVAEAEDNMYSGLGGPNKKSATTELKIVAPMEIQIDLVRRQLEVALEFSQALLSQGTSVEKSRAAAAAFGGAKPEFETSRMHLAESVSGQIAVAVQVAKAAGQMQAIWQEMTNNRVFEARDHAELMNEIVTPLKDISKPIEAVTGTLNQALDLIKDGKGDPQKLQDTLNSAADSQARLLEQLTAIHKKLMDHSNRNELINQVMTLQAIWDKAMKETDRVRKMQAAALLGATNPATMPATAPAGN